MAKEYTKTQLKAKEQGISGWHVKKNDTLIAEMGVEKEETTIDTPVVEKKAPAPKKAPTESPELKLLKLMVGFTWDQAKCNIMMLDKKSRFFEFKDLVENNWKEERGK